MPDICGSSAWNLLHVTPSDAENYEAPRFLENCCTPCMHILHYKIQKDKLKYKLNRLLYLTFNHQLNKIFQVRLE
jgi:hypothetical protein